MTGSPSPRVRYWRKHGTLIIVLLAIWFLVPNFGGIFYVQELNKIQIGGFPLGFWIAQQGSIIVFLILLLIYALMMGKFDREYHQDRQAAGEEAAP